MKYKKLVDDYFKALRRLETDPEYREMLAEIVTPTKKDIKLISNFYKSDNL